MGLKNLIDVIKQIQKENPLFSKRLAEAEALGRWPIAVGEMIAKHTRPVRVSHSVLWVEFDHPSWEHELLYRKRQILDILNGYTPAAKPGLTPPSEVLLDIRFFDRGSEKKRNYYKYLTKKKPTQFLPK